MKINVVRIFETLKKDGSNFCQIFVRGPGQLLKIDSSNIKWEPCRYWHFYNTEKMPADS